MSKRHLSSVQKNRLRQAGKKAIFYKVTLKSAVLKD
jgi:hypothetical protein